MSQRLRILGLCFALVLGLTAAVAAEDTLLSAPGTTGVTQPAPQGDVASGTADGPGQTLSDEDFARLFANKPVNMCGVFCGINDPSVRNCTLACGDAAFCYHGSCAYW